MSQIKKIHNREKMGKLTIIFTLIELLLVIAIIAILLTILLPALKNVKMKAKSIICTGNLKQMGIIFQGYTQDHDGWMLPTFIESENIPWSDILNEQEYYDISDASSATVAYQTQGPAVCPLNPGRYGRSLTNYALATQCGFISSSSTKPWRKIHDIPISAGNAPVWGDSQWRDVTASGFPHYCNYRFSDSDDITWIYHSGTSANFVFLDGHTEKKKRSDLSASFFTWDP